MMKAGAKTAFGLLLLAALVSFSFPEKAPGSGGDEKPVYRVGVSAAGLGNVNRNDLNAALRAWAETIKKEQHLDADLDVGLLTGSVAEMREALLLNELDGISVTVSELMAMGIEPEAVFVGDRGDGPEVRYVLIGRENGKVQSPEDLPDGSIAMTDNQRMIMAMPWLETVLLQSDPGYSGRKLKRPNLEENPSKAILQVFFHQADAAVVTLQAFELACELNPQLRKDLKIIAESPPFITAFFIFRPSAEREKNIALLEKAVLNLHKTPGGRQVLTIIQSSRMQKHPISLLDTTIRFLKLHERLVTVPLFVGGRP